MGLAGETQLICGSKGRINSMLNAKTVENGFMTHVPDMHESTTFTKIFRGKNLKIYIS